MKISTFFTLSDFSISLPWQPNFLLLVFAFVNYSVMFVAGNVHPNVFCQEPRLVSSDFSKKSSVVHSTFQFNSFFNVKCVLSTLYEFIIM